MKIKAGLFALVAASSLVFIGGANASAETQPTPQKPAAMAPATQDKNTYVTVNEGDSLSSIAEPLGTTFVRLFNANPNIADPNVINAGDKLRVPTSSETLPDRYGNMTAQAAAVPAAASTAPTTTYRGAARSYSAPAAVSYTRGSSAGNTYAPGNCTWYVKNMRGDLPNQLGNGGSWAANAAAQGFATGSAPRAGAVAEQPGHVAYVQSVNSNGTVNISEMNYAGGFGRVSQRTAPASMFNYIY